VPHDANVKELGTGRTRIETFRALGVNMASLLKRFSFQDSIEAARTFLSEDIYISERDCPNLIKAIQLYRKQYDEKLDIFLERDVHDIHSHYGAALRYLVQGVTRYLVDKPSSRVIKSSLFGDFAL